MTIDILIPHFKETTEEVKPLLDSLATQQNVNFEEVGVIIANDGPEATKLDLPKYPFKVSVFDAPKGGVSATRNFALSKSKADYVMFCDADDMFYSNIGLFVVMQEAEKSHFDYMVSTFIEETRHPVTKEVMYIPHDVDSTFVHGKVIRRKFLEDSKIRWNDALTIHEDSYFNILCLKLSANSVHCPLPWYLWRWRDASVCRHDPKYLQKTFGNMLDSSTALVNELIKRDKVKEAAEIAVQMIFDSYFTLNKTEWRIQENKQYRDRTEKRFSEYWREFKSMYYGTPEMVRNQTIAALKNRFFNEGLFLESITFDDWIASVEKL